jgi:hypothetical protein
LKKSADWRRLSPARTGRLTMDKYIEHHVEQIARHENRTLSNAIGTLLKEAIRHRQQRQEREPNGATA